jgi:hypothetical protein
MTWIPFAPVVGTANEQRQYLDYARHLLESASIQEEGADKLPPDQLRRQLVENRRQVPAAVRAALLILLDLIAQGWKWRSHNGAIEIGKPLSVAGPEDERDRVRAQLHVERNRQLETRAVRNFIAKMERRRFHRGRWVSVFSLMRDGSHFAHELRCFRDKPATPVDLTAFQKVMRPYLQVIRGDDVCEQTGFLLADIWRYFRYTWANPYRSVPGRSLMLLVRDGAVEPHPVIGIAALASSAVQIAVRDDWIGWSPEAYVDRLRYIASERHVDWLLGLIAEGLAGIYQDDFLDPAFSPLTRRAIAKPTSEVIAWLEAHARMQREEHYRLADAAQHKSVTVSHVDSADDPWQRQAETPLFRSKRAETIAMLLRARAALGSCEEPLSPSKFRMLLESPGVRQPVQALVRRAKSERVGVAMADISVCGAIPPYSAVLGGKLIAMLLVSPEIITAYRDRYAQAESVIASSLAGRPVVRSPHLVFLGTTSLYGTEPTQYTRVVVPNEIVGGPRGETLRYQLLGRTEGYGTLQFSTDTVHALSVLLSQRQGGQRVHSIFGEGVNPRLRKVRDGLNHLGLPSDLLLIHGSPRLAYGVALARNFREYLLGLDPEPDYLVPSFDPKGASDRIALWWAHRWLRRRIMREDVLDAVERHQLTYPVRHGARVKLPADFGGQLPLFDDVSAFGAEQSRRSGFESE